MAGRVEGKVAVIMGGGQTPGETIGNGRATALLLAREGARVLVVDRMRASAEETVAKIRAEGGEAAAFEADVVDEGQVRAAVEECVRLYGRLDLLQNNIGASLTLGDAPATELTVESFDRIYAVNLRGMWLASKHALPRMRDQRGGSIVNISSMAAWAPYPNLGYKTTKVAVIGLTENLAMANAQYGIRVNAILPGLMNTPMAIEARVAAGGTGRKSSPPATGRCRWAVRWAPPGTSPTRRSSCTATRRASSPASRSPWTAARTSRGSCVLPISARG